MIAMTLEKVTKIVNGTFLGDTEALSFFDCPFFSTSIPELPTLTPMATFFTFAAA